MGSEYSSASEKLPGLLKEFLLYNRFQLSDKDKEGFGEQKSREVVKGNEAMRCHICGLEFGKEQHNEAYEHYEECALTQRADNWQEDPLNYNIFKEFKSKLETLRIPWDEGYVKLFIGRSELLLDSYCQLSDLNSRQLRSEFQVIFEGELAQDAGGLTKEWLNLLSKDLLTNDLRLFKPTNTEDKRFRISNNSLPEFHKLLGRVIGKAILSDIPLNCPLSFVILKQILGQHVPKEDIRYIDLDLYKAMKFMESEPIEGVFFETFSVIDKDRVVPLVDHGQEISVTDENKDEYISLRAEYELQTSAFESLKALKSGIFDVVPEEFFHGMGCEELDLLICGKLEVDLEDWRRFTEYRGSYGPGHQVICWFWEVLGDVGQEKMGNLLSFVTGCSRAPVEGFEHLKTHRGESAWFSIESVGFSKGVLPRAHTCFNRIDLPVYPSKKDLRDALEFVMGCGNLGFYLE